MSACCLKTSMMNLKVSRGLKVSFFGVNLSCWSIFKSSISLTRHSSRFIYAITIKMRCLAWSLRLLFNSVSSNIKEEESGARNS